MIPSPFLPKNMELIKAADILAQRYSKLPSEILNLPADEFYLNCDVINIIAGGWKDEARMKLQERKNARP